MCTATAARSGSRSLAYKSVTYLTPNPVPVPKRKLFDREKRPRISPAKEFIRCEDRPISLVAEATGFSDLRTFERAFKKCTGMTPSEYKKSVRPS